MRCIETGQPYQQKEDQERLIVTWDVLKPISKTTVNNSSDRLIVTWDVLKLRLLYSGEAKTLD